MKSNEKIAKNDRDTLVGLFNLAFVIIATLLTGYMVFGNSVSEALKTFSLFSELDTTEVSDRMTVILLLFICALLFLVLPRMRSLRALQRKSNLISYCATALLLISFGWRWGDEYFESLGTRLWFGWGDKSALLLLVLGILGAYLIRDQNSINSLRLNKTGHLPGIFAGTIFTIYYLPSFIQPFNGIIELHHSKYVLNDLLIQASGQWPYSDVMPQYVGILGLPLKLASIISPSFTVNSALLWVNFLVVAEVFLLAWITRKVLHLKSWAVSTLLPVSVIFVKVQPNTEIWGSIAQHINLVPARTVLPIVLLSTLLRLSKTQSFRNQQLSASLVGLVAAVTAFNNPEFGIPASITAIIILTALLLNRRLTVASFSTFISTLLLTFGLIFAIYALFGESLSISTWLTMIRIHGMDGYMNLPMPDFGLWIFFYAILGCSAIIGALLLFKRVEIEGLDVENLNAVIVLTFSGLWGSSTLFYFSGRSLVPEIVVFLIPLSLSISGLMQIFKSSVSKSFLSESPANSLVASVPILLIALIPMVSLVSAPNPAFEWRRVSGHGERWSANRLLEVPSFGEMTELVADDPSNKYVFFGNNGPAIEILSNIENGLGIISLTDISINPLMAKVACKTLGKSGADFAIAPKVDWADDWEYTSPPCPKMKLVRFNEDSELLIFEINKEE